MIDLASTFPLRCYMNLGRAVERRFETQYELAVASLKADRWPCFDSSYMRSSRGYPSVRHAAHALSLRTLLRHAHHHRTNLLLFEDDVMFSPSLHPVLADATLPEDWSLFYLGCLHIETPSWQGRHVVRVSQALDTHALGVRWDVIPSLLAHLSPRNPRYLNEPAASDVRLLDFQRESPCYAIHPNVTGQRQVASGIDQGANTKYHPDCSQAWCREAVEPLSSGHENEDTEELAAVD